jgi:WhiB family redox-sensing transcriptional regulator
MIQTHHYSRPISAPVGLLDGWFATPEWMRQGTCSGGDGELWFSIDPTDREYAKAVCADCPVLTQCAEWGMREQYGVWGGMTEAERRSVRRRNRSGAAG